MKKSYVTMETAICPVCGKESETGAILLDQHLRDRFEMKTPTGWGLCPEHKKLEEDGFIALVEAEHPPEGVVRMGPGEARRTGLICHLKREVARQIFDMGAAVDLPLIFVEPGVIPKINSLIADAAAREENQRIMDSTRT